MSTIGHNTTVDVGIQQHSLLRSTVLHLLPGVLILVFFIIAAPLAERMRAPSLLAFLLAVTFVQIPFQLGYLLYQGRKRNGRLSLKGVVLYREPMPVWQYAVLGLPCLIWLFAIPFAVFTPIDNYLMETLFSSLPDWFFQLRFAENPDQYSMPFLWLAGTLMLVVGMIPGPLVEELYYRGYLLPRMSRLGSWAPLINVTLFSLYHFYQPWRYPAAIVAFLPLVYAVWWKKNIHLGIIVHCALMIISALGMLAPMLGPA